MEINKKKETTNDTQNLTSKSTKLASSSQTSNNLPAIKPKSEISLAKEFTNGVIKALSNPEVSREGTFEENAAKTRR